MATVTDVVTGALVLLEVNVSEAAIEAPEAEDGLTALNDMMNELPFGELRTERSK